MQERGWGKSVLNKKIIQPFLLLRPTYTAGSFSSVVSQFLI